MWNRIKQLKKLWALAKKDKAVMDEFMKLSSKEIMDLPDEDQKAVFISQGSNEEFKDYENEKKFGVKKLFGIE